MGKLIGKKTSQPMFEDDERLEVQVFNTEKAQSSFGVLLECF